MRDVWRLLAIEELETYPAKKEAMTTIPERLRELESAFVSIGSPSADKVAVQGGGGNDKALNNIVMRDEYERRLEEAGRLVARVERGLAILTDEEKETLERKYIHPEKGWAERIAQARGVEKNKVYNTYENAIRKFKTAMHG